MRFQKNDKTVITNAGKKLYPVTIGRQAFAGCITLTEVKTVGKYKYDRTNGIFRMQRIERVESTGRSGKYWI